MHHTEIAQTFEEQYARLFRSAYRVTGNASDAEDVVQNVFLRLVRSEGGAAGVQNLPGYLHRAAINASLDLLRSRAGQAHQDLESAPPDRVPNPWGSAESVQMRHWLRQALAQLSPRHAEMFTLRYIEGYDNREIGQLLDTSQAVIAVTLHRVRGQLQKKYRESQRRAG